MATISLDAVGKNPTKRSILDMTCDEARSFFLKHASYCSIDLPPYFHFDNLLCGVNKVLNSHELRSLSSGKPRNCEDVNHRILNNKDGKHAWRPFEVIHPVLYVSLVRHLTKQEHWETILKRFSDYAQLKKITCLSLPIESLTHEKDRAEQVSHWWLTIEQKSIELALDYECVVHADITDCYGAIYTHSIVWAIHGKSKAKNNRDDCNLIGNIVDSHIQDMRHGQTNGIPQGSVLMDFIAEIVLGYADLELAKKIEEEKVADYLVLRYRDDYRIFVNNLQDGDRILKCLTEVMIGLGLKLNATKTKSSNLVVGESIKPDKLAWIYRKQYQKDLQKRLLIIYSHSLEFPNTGSLIVALADYYNRLSKRKKCHQPRQLISIIVDIAYRNPRTYPICSAILSLLLGFLENEEAKISIVEKIEKRFKQLPNTGHMEIWLQRISHPFASEIQFDEPLCKLVQDKDVSIWNNDWISSRQLKNALSPKLIIDREEVEKLDPIVSVDEVDLFMLRSNPYL